MTEKRQKFTPGPWRISGAAEGAGITIEAKRNTLVAFVRDNQHPLTDVNEHEATANARLIAQAPALYQALHDLMELPDNQDCDCGLAPIRPCEYCRAEAALLAAEGGKP